VYNALGEPVAKLRLIRFDNMLTRRVIIILLVLLIITTSLSCTTPSGYTSTFITGLTPGAQKTSLEEAADIIGVSVPVPTYLPAGFEIQEVYIQDSYEVKLIISDQEVEDKKQVSPGHYGVQCKMALIVRWLPPGFPDIKIPDGRVEFNGSAGWFAEHEDHNDLWWNLYETVPPQGFFELVLVAIKEIPKSELVKVAASVGW